jgi:hypothetical protein
MIEDRVEKLLDLWQNNKLLIIDKDGFADYIDYAALLQASGYGVVNYTNVEAFRVLYEERLKSSAEKIAVVVRSDIYVPYDI